jgi:DNA-binding response OmpR family regulator
MDESDMASKFKRVEVFIAHLRRKLGASFIETVRCLGYRIQ